MNASVDRNGSARSDGFLHRVVDPFAKKTRSIEHRAKSFSGRPTHSALEGPGPKSLIFDDVFHVDVLHSSVYNHIETTMCF